MCSCEFRTLKSPPPRCMCPRQHHRQNKICILHQIHAVDLQRHWYFCKCIHCVNWSGSIRPAFPSGQSLIPIPGPRQLQHMTNLFREGGWRTFCFEKISCFRPWIPPTLYFRSCNLRDYPNPLFPGRSAHRPGGCLEEGCWRKVRRRVKTIKKSVHISREGAGHCECQIPHENNIPSNMLCHF